MKGGRAGLPAAFFFVLLFLFAMPLWAGDVPAQNSTALEETAKTVTDASKTDKERVSAASLLTESDDPKSIEPLFAVIRDPKERPILRAAIIHKLAKSPQKQPIADFLIGRLQDLKEASEVRGAAASVLGSLGLPAGKKPLGRASSDKNPQVRQAARDALLLLDGQDIDRIGLLIAVLQDKDQRAAVRARAARQLGEIKDIRASQALILALKEKIPDIPDSQDLKGFFAARSRAKEHLPAAAARALGQIGGPAAVSPLISMSQTPDSEFRTAIFEALAMLKAPDAVPAARKAILYDTDHRVRRWAGVILKDSADKDTLPELLKALKDIDPGVRLQAAQAVGKIKDCKAIKDMEETLAMEENKEVKEAMEKAVQGLKESKTPCELFSE